MYLTIVSLHIYSMSRYTVSNYFVVISHSSAVINRYDTKSVKNSSRAPVITLDFYRFAFEKPACPVLKGLILFRNEMQSITRNKRYILKFGDLTLFRKHFIEKLTLQIIVSFTSTDNDYMY